MNLKNISYLLLLFFLVGLQSCRKEEVIIVDPADNGSTLTEAQAELFRRTSLNDGSVDNIIDSASCFSVKLPVTVTVNGQVLIVDSPLGYVDIEAIFDDLDDDEDLLTISFPITIILEDFSEVLVSSESEFLDLVETCGPENSEDDDIECIDIIYPISIAVIEDEFPQTLTLNEDEDLFDFIEDLDNYTAIDIQFPIQVRLADGTIVDTNTLEGLISAINSAANTCDEDDDNDYDDDDCADCSANTLSDILTSCSAWVVDKLEVMDQDLEDNYDGFSFSFLTDGTVQVSSSGGAFSGTWSVSDGGSDVSFDLNISGLDDFTGGWSLHEISQGSETDIDLRTPSDDRLRFETECGN